MISIRRLSGGFEVKTRSVLPNSKPVKFRADSIHRAVLCVYHYFGEHFKDNLNACPICRSARPEAKP